MCWRDRHDFAPQRWHHHDFGPDPYHRPPLPHQHCGPDCWREGIFGFRRQFISNKELLEGLKRYLQELENEAQGVREAIAELEAEIGVRDAG